MTVNSSDDKQSPALAVLVTLPPTPIQPSTAPAPAPASRSTFPAQHDDPVPPTSRPSQIRSRSSYLRQSTTSNSSSRTSASASTSTRSIEASSRRGNTSRKSRKQAQAQAEQAEEEAATQLELNRRLASLQLPHMPASILTGGPNSLSEPPTIRILVVADIDLESVSALAESALQDMPQENPLQRVDLCIACGPFCHEDDLTLYYQGRQRRRHAARHGAAYHSKARSSVPIQAWRGGGGSGSAGIPLPPMPQHSTSYYQNTPHSKRSTYPTGPISSYPYKRTREETAALEGLMTAALSQLESIVCRVLFVPGKSDPISTITSSPTSLSYTKERRLTPNSRNIHQHWIPLCPGLGCAGLLYVDGQKLQQQPPPLEDDDEGIEDDDVTDSSHLLPEDSSFSYDREENATSVPFSSISPTQLPVPSLQKLGASCGVASYEQQVKDYGYEFCQQLQDLVRLAPPLEAISNSAPSHAQVNDLMRTELFQSILVTHFHHFEPEYSSFSHEESKGIPMGETSINLGDQESEDEEEDDEEESFDPPWPIDHEAFCALPQVQEHVLLEIAAGCNSQGRSVRPMEVPKGMLRVVLPGSLRERGEFCLVDISFMKTTGAIAGSKHGDYRWIVRQTQFQTLEDYI